MPHLEKSLSPINSKPSRNLVQFIGYRCLFFIALNLISSSLSKVSGDVIVFDSYNSPLTGSFSSTGREIGNTIQLAGTERTVTEFGVRVSAQNREATADFIVRFYANDGIGGQPGTLLGETPLLSDVAASGNGYGVTWSGLSITVPDTFTWTLQIYDPTPIVVGLAEIAGNSSVGSITATWFGDSNIGWTSASTVSPYAAYVVAVPEPPARNLVLASFFIAACFVLNRRLQIVQLPRIA